MRRPVQEPHIKSRRFSGLLQTISIVNELLSKILNELINMISLLFTLIYLASNAVAGPTADGTIKPAGYCPVSEFYIARFDNLRFYEKTYNPIPEYYNDLTFWNFQVHRDNGFIPAVSGDKTANAYGGSGSISIPDSYSHLLPISYLELMSRSAYKQTFDLRKLFYACYGWPQQKECTIKVSGFKPDGSIVQKDLPFPALWEGIQPWQIYMNVTEFDSEWQGLTKVDFNITETDAGVLLDDVEYNIITGC
jgi:hypothetical protein